MQSVLGRLLVRAFSTRSQSELQFRQRSIEPLNFVTGSSGFSKSLAPLSPTGTKKWSYGDDAFFIARHKLADVLGVADGVGGWRSYGIDPSAFPQSLMSTCLRLIKEGRFHPSTPGRIIEDSYQEILNQKQPLIGSSTACVVALHKEERTMYTANLGDSGFLLIRDGEVVHRSVEQQHYFNTPFQLGVPPPEAEGFVLNDSAEMANRSSFKVEEGDILLLGTDGLFDNLHEDMIVDFIAKYKDQRDSSMQATASNIAEKAYQLSLDPDYLSPFAVSAINNGIQIKGGKPDDITVVLARVSCEPEVEL